MPRDPMTSYEQADAEALERFYEEQEDRERAEGDRLDEQEQFENDCEDRDPGDDDGVEYADPRDEQEERRRALDVRFDELVGFSLGPRPE